MKFFENMVDFNFQRYAINLNAYVRESLSNDVDYTGKNSVLYLHFLYLKNNKRID